MRRLMLAAVMVMALVACGSDALVNSAYTASGDGSRPDDLTQTRIFRPDDDLNVVVTLNPHNRAVPVYAIFYGPDGSTYTTDNLNADETVGHVLLGLDWEAQGSAAWAEGEWRVEVYVDSDIEKTDAQPKETIRFTIQSAEPAAG